MKRVGHLFEGVADFGALCAAARRALRGKRATRASQAFDFHLEGECLALQRELLDGTYRPRPYRTFTVSDPKPRTISAADVRDRAVHHALCAVLEPVFERVAIGHSYACRRGKGSHAAVREAQRQARRHPYFLKLDVRKFFETADHGVLRAALRRLIKDARLLGLVDRFIDHGAPGSPPGRGLPIGNLTSQHFANFYLGALDRHVLQDLRVGAYLRYMDDLLLFDASKDRLRHAEAAVAAFARDRLRLEVKTEATVLAPVTEGIPFLGFRVWPGVVRLGGPLRRRVIRGIRDRDRALAAGRCDGDTWQRSMASRIGMLSHAGTTALRRSVFGAEGGAGTTRAPTG